MTILNPCVDAVLSFDPATVPNPLDYVLFAPTNVQKVSFTTIFSSETLAICPDIAITVVKDDLTPIDGAVFSHDPQAETLTTFSEDPLKVGSYPMQIVAQYNGVPGYYNSFSFPFTVNVIDVCLNNAVIMPSVQTNPPDYLYTAFAPPADFSLTPFTVFPPFCIETLSCATIVGPADLCSIPAVSTFDAVTGAF